MTNFDYQSDTWMNILDRVRAEFHDGQTIKHEWLREVFNIHQPTIQEYPSIPELMKAMDMVQFEYMTLIERMKEDLLKIHKVCIKNERGVGYRILLPEEQVTYAYDKLNDDIAKSLRIAGLITSNVRSITDHEQRAKDNNLRAKIGSMKTFMTSIR